MKREQNPRKKAYVILPREDGRWLLARDGTPSQSRIFASLAEAVEVGRKAARKDRAPLRVLTEKRAERLSHKQDADPGRGPDPRREPR